MDKFADNLVEDGLSSLVVSIDGPPSIHNKIRGVENIFEKAYKGVEKILIKRRQMGRILPKVKIAYAISNYNYDCLEETVGIFNKLGVDHFIFQHLDFVDVIMVNLHNREYGHIFGKVSPSNITAVDPQKVDIKILMEQINSVRNKYDGFVNFYPNLTKIDQLQKYYYGHEFLYGNKCIVAWRNMQILSNGDVIPSSRCFNLIMGNIYKQSFKEIWYGKLYSSFRENLKIYGATSACARCCGLINS